jgi:predicted small secreted protein
MKKLVFAMIGALILAGCNTIAGVGEDTQALGKKLEYSAERHQHYTP